jgi:hypothetical protein
MSKQIIRMILRNNEKESIVKVVLDFGTTIPILNKFWVPRN